MRRRFDTAHELAPTMAAVSAGDGPTDAVQAPWCDNQMLRVASLGAPWNIQKMPKDQRNLPAGPLQMAESWLGLVLASWKVAYFLVCL